MLRVYYDKMVNKIIKLFRTPLCMYYLCCLGESARNTSGQFGDKQQILEIWSQSAKKPVLIYWQRWFITAFGYDGSWDIPGSTASEARNYESIRPCLQIKVTNEVRNLRRGLCLRVHLIVYKNCTLLLKQVIKQWSAWFPSSCLQFYSSRVQFSELFVICVALHHEAKVLRGILERSRFSCKYHRSFPFVQQITEVTAMSMGPHPHSKEAACEADTSLAAECFKCYPVVIGHRFPSAGSKCWESVDVTTKFGTSRNTD